MNFKEFIKFSWKKLIISIIIFVLGFSSFIVAKFGTQACLIGGPPCQQPFYYYILKAIGYILVLPILILDSINGFVVVVGLILTIFYVYLLACLINLIIERIRTKSQ